MLTINQFDDLLRDTTHQNKSNIPYWEQESIEWLLPPHKLAHNSTKTFAGICKNTSINTENKLHN